MIMIKFCDFRKNTIQNIDYVQELEEEPSVARNYMSIKHTAAASLRFQSSAAQTAVICTAFLKDLIEAGVVTHDKT